MTAHDSLNILLMGDASNYHNSLAIGLRRMGHHVTVASNGSRWMQTDRDIDITRHPGKLGGAMFWLNLMRRRRLFAGYDIVQLAGTGFIDQRPQRILSFFNYLRRHNKHLFMTSLGTDTNYIDFCLDPSSPLRYNEWMINGEESPHALMSKKALMQWHTPDMERLCDAVYTGVEGAVTALYEYHMSCQRVMSDEKIDYAGIPINVDAIEPVTLPDKIDKVRLVLCAHSYRMVEKGADRILAAARRVEARHGDRCTVEVVTGLPYNTFVDRMRHAHVILDQLYSYTPATTALLAMANGIPVLSGGEEQFYDFIGEHELRPIYNAIPDDQALERAIEQIVLNPDDLRRRSIESRLFVERHNNTDIVAKRFMQSWQKRM